MLNTYLVLYTDNPHTSLISLRRQQHDTDNRASPHFDIYATNVLDGTASSSSIQFAIQSVHNHRGIAARMSLSSVLEINDPISGFYGILSLPAHPCGSPRHENKSQHAFGSSDIVAYASSVKDCRVPLYIVISPGEGRRYKGIMSLEELQIFRT